MENEFQSGNSRTNTIDSGKYFRYTSEKYRKIEDEYMLLLCLDDLRVIAWYFRLLGIFVRIRKLRYCTKSTGDSTRRYWRENRSKSVARSLGVRLGGMHPLSRQCSPAMYFYQIHTKVFITIHVCMGAPMHTLLHVKCM